MKNKEVEQQCFYDLSRLARRVNNGVLEKIYTQTSTTCNVAIKAETILDQIALLTDQIQSHLSAQMRGN